MTIAELRELVARATPGRWEVWTRKETAASFDIKASGELVACAFESDESENAALIAAAVNHLGPLLDLWEAMEGDPGNLRRYAELGTGPIAAAIARLGER